MDEITIKCKKIVGGVASGEVMVSHTPISWVSEVDETNGRIMPKGHELEGMSVAGRILIYPEAKGSTFVGVTLEVMADFKCQPKEIVMLEQPDHATMQGVIVANIPTVCLPEENSLALIHTGDFVEGDATNGLIRVKPTSKS